MFVVTKEMDIAAEIKVRATRSIELRKEISEYREHAMMSDDRYMINNRDRELPQYAELQQLQSEMAILEEGYIDPELIAKAKQMYYDFNGGDYDRAGPNVQKSWLALAKKS